MSDTFIDRWKNRKNLSMSVDVPYHHPDDPDHLEITFQIERFAEAERSGIERKCLLAGMFVSERFPETKDSVFQRAFVTEYEVAMFDVLKRHIRGWTHTPKEGDPLQYSKSLCDEMLKNVTWQEAQGLVTRYVDLLTKDEEEAKKKVQGGSVENSASEPSTELSSES